MGTKNWYLSAIQPTRRRLRLVVPAELLLVSGDRDGNTAD